VVGHKPTHGLVPYTGCIGIENTIDHAGPLAPDVETAAKTLSVLAGKDPKDPRQPDSVPTDDYFDRLDETKSDISIGVVEEGFERPGNERAVNDAARDGIATLESRGATVTEVSIPTHDHAQDIYTVSGEGLGHNWKGWYNTSWVEAFGKARRARGGDLPPSVKLTLLTGAYAKDRYHSTYYTQAMNLRAELTEQYDEILADYDVLAMPTTPMRANEYVPDQDHAEFIADSWGNLANTCVFNMTGHPSLSVPVDAEGDLPVGLMLTGSQFEDAHVLNAGYVLEDAMA
jgi:amidase